MTRSLTEHQLAAALTGALIGAIGVLIGWDIGRFVLSPLRYSFAFAWEGYAQMAPLGMLCGMIGWFVGLRGTAPRRALIGFALGPLCFTIPVGLFLTIRALGRGSIQIEGSTLVGLLQWFWMIHVTFFTAQALAWVFARRLYREGRA